MMTLRARALGMTRTVFRNASGLPDPEQVTTARDMAMLAAIWCSDFPAEYRYFTTPGFLFHGQMIPNHDHMLQTYPGADGIKTGYTEAAGHNLVTSAVRGDVRLIGVVLGAASNPERDVHMAALLDQGFERMDVPVMPRGAAIRLPSLIVGGQAAPAPVAAPHRPAALERCRSAPSRPSRPPARPPPGPPRRRRWRRAGRIRPACTATPPGAPCSAG